MVLIALMAGAVHAAGVAYPHWDGNPAMVHAGEQNYLSLGLQNMVGDQDLRFTISFLRNDGDIAYFEDYIYDVPAGRDDIEARLYYHIPEGAQPGDEYIVQLNVVTSSPDVAGGIEAGVGFQNTVPFVVQPEAPATSPPSETGAGGYGYLVYLFVALVIVGIIVYFVMRKKKE